MANYISKHTGKQIDAAVDAFLAGGGTGSVEVDTTLTQAGKAADAKETGDRLTALTEEIEGLKASGGGGSSGGAATIPFVLSGNIVRCEPIPGTQLSVESDADVTVYSCGKNLVGLSAGNTGVITRNGVTFTFEDDGSVTLNGTPTGNFYPVFWSGTGATVKDSSGDYGIDKMLKLPESNYCFSCTFSGHAEGTNHRPPSIRVYLADGTAYGFSGDTAFTAGQIQGINSVTMGCYTDTTYTNYRKSCMIGGVYFDESGTAYYVDDTANRTRYIILNTQCNDYELNADGTAKYNYMRKHCFTQKQYDFLTEEALVGLTDRWHVVVGAHIPLNAEGEAFGDKGVMLNLLKAYRNKATYSTEYAGTAESGFDSVSINADFTSAKGNFIGYFAGHLHDGYHYANATYGIDMIGIPSDRSRDGMTAGTDTEQSFDVVTVDTKNKKIYCTKIGFGEDREISYA